MLVATLVCVALMMPAHTLTASSRAGSPPAHTPAHAGEAAPQPLAQAPVIGAVRVRPAGSIDRFAKFEVAFDVTSTTATNPYFPYDSAPPPGISPGAGISVDARLLPPGQSNWANSKTLPCFYYQPVQELGSVDNSALLPTGKAEWRCRFTPEIVGTWQYEIRATDAAGTGEGPVHQFGCVRLPPQRVRRD